MSSVPANASRLSNLMANAGRHRPRDLLWSLDRARMAPLLLDTGSALSAAPLWAWLRDATRRGEFWDAEDLRLLDAWTGHPDGGWWLLPTRATVRGTPSGLFVEDWLAEVEARKQQDNPRVHAMLATVPQAWRQGERAASHAASAMNAERRAMNDSHSATAPATPLSVAMLALGADPFRAFQPPSSPDFGKPCFASLSHPQHLEWAARLHPDALAAWLAEPFLLAALLRGMPPGALRTGVLSRVAAARGWRQTSDPSAAEHALDALVTLCSPTNTGLPAWKASVHAARPHFAATDTQGRTLFMLAMETPIREASPITPILAAFGKTLRIRANREGCRGRDAAGRTLWPYFLAALPGHASAGRMVNTTKAINASVHFARAIEEKVGLPAPDAEGHALLHQMLHALTPDGGLVFRHLAAWGGDPQPLAPRSPWRLTRLFRTANQAPIWLGNDAALAKSLLERLHDELPCDREEALAVYQASAACGTLEFLATLAENLVASAPSVDPAWQSLFLVSTMLAAATQMGAEKSPSLVFQEKSRRIIEGWMQPSALLPLWARERVLRQDGLTASQTAVFAQLFERQDVLNQANVALVALDAKATPRPRRRS